MTHLIAVDRQGAEHKLPWPPQATVMEVLRDNGLGVEAVCGGCCSCATCHVYVELSWQAKTGQAGAMELELLGLSEHLQPGVSRLSCQIERDESLNGLVVQVAPEE